VAAALAVWVLALAGAGTALGKQKPRAKVVAFPNGTGAAGVLAPAGVIDPEHSFFKSLGGNGRTCGICHVPEGGWSLTPELAQARFAESGGLYELFRPHDGANGPGLDVGTEAARLAAYSLLLQRAVFRIELPVPPGAEFAVSVLADPHDAASPGAVAMFRRPLPATNLRFQTTVMWDGRESPEGRSLPENLAAQAQAAHLGHAQGAPLSQEQLQALADFELGFHSAQIKDARAGSLTQKGGKGGPAQLAREAFYPGINDPFGPDPQGRAFQPPFRLFQKWTRSTAGRRAAARGEAVFNTRAINIRNVGGLNDVLGQDLVVGTCATCHNTPAEGSNSLGLLMDLNVEGLMPANADAPLYQFQRLGTAEAVALADPGAALVTGRWADLRRFKVPSLRNLAARPPYFHDGSAPGLADVVDFYDRRFGMGLTPGERDDLLAFLLCL